MRYSRYFPIAMLCLLAIAALAPQTASAFQLFPGENPAGDFRDYVIAFYNFSISAGILIATVLIMIGGMIWVTSAGNSSRVELAKSYIIDSIIGVILLIGAVVILRLINPALVELPRLAITDLDGSSGACIYQAKTASNVEYTKCESSSELFCTGGDTEGGLQGSFREGKTCQEVCPPKQSSTSDRPGECEVGGSGSASPSAPVNRAFYCGQFSTSGEAVNQRVRDAGRYDTWQNCQTYCEERSSSGPVSCSGTYDNSIGRCNCS